MVLSPTAGEWLLFQPSRGDTGLPPILQGVQGEDLTLTAEDGVQIKAWWYQVREGGEPSPSAPAVLLLHGNAGDIA
ncbi:MAG: alpha/beta hydrolase, partial [Gemmatimonadetes bacterium]|nr:alpha/beta hydrolase [Gemmatimonadota bacterium]